MIPRERRLPNDEPRQRLRWHGANAGAASSAELAGSRRRARLGRYELGPKIADGGMATIHLGRRAPDRRLVAIKRIREDFARSKEFLTMFLDEGKLVARLRHPGIVRYLELGDDGPQAFIAMELLRGQTLWSVWEACRGRGVRLRAEIIAWVGARVAEGLHYAHELVDERGRPLDVVHRDVNATNIFVTYDGAVKVLDFGLAKAANRASKTAAGIIKGKVAYMSPEQAVGAPIDRRTDIFALGTTLWELACDRRLFKHPDEVETLRRVHAAEVPDPTALVQGFPPALARVILKALERQPERRYTSGADLARELDAYGRGRAGKAELVTMMRELFAEDQRREEAWGDAAPLPDGDDSRPQLETSREGTARDEYDSAVALAALGGPASDERPRSAGPDRSPVTPQPQATFPETVVQTAKAVRPLRAPRSWLVLTLVALVVSLALTLLALRGAP